MSSASIPQGTVTQLVSEFNQYGPTPAPAPIVHTQVTMASDLPAVPVSQEPVSTPQVTQSGPQPIDLRPHQVDHFRRVQSILPGFYFYIDGSEMGTGKTKIALATCVSTNLPFICFCPLGARKTWVREQTLHGVPCYNLPEVGGIMTYNCLAGTKGHQPKHGLLYRVDGSNGTEYHPTPLLIQLLQAGVLIFFDEAQKLKNTSLQAKAAKAIIRALYSHGGRSRAGLLSGSIMDKEEQATNFMRLVGFIESRNLYSKNRHRGVVLEGIQEIQNWARRANATAADQFMATHQFRASRKAAAQYVYEIFTEVIKPAVMSIMPRPEYDAVKDVKNGYYTLPAEDDVEYRQAVSSLAAAVRYNQRDQSVMITAESMGAVTSALVRLQNAKKRAAVRVIRERLQALPNVKVLFAADYYDVIDYLLQELRDYSPVELTGRLSEAVRSRNIDRFNEQNLNCRLMIMNPKVGGLSVDLHDPTGQFPREAYAMPGYSINDLHQWTGRFYRDGVKGYVKIRFFYGLSGARENSILAAIARKGAVMHRVHIEQGTIFPDEYDDEYEQELDGPEYEMVFDDDEVASTISGALNAMRNLVINTAQ